MPLSKSQFSLASSVPYSSIGEVVNDSVCLAVSRFVTVDLSTVTVTGARNALVCGVLIGAFCVLQVQPGKVRLTCTVWSRADSPACQSVSVLTAVCTGVPAVVTMLVRVLLT